MKLGDLRGVIEGKAQLVVVEENKATSVRKIVFSGDLYGGTYQYNDCEVENMVASCKAQEDYNGCDLRVVSQIEIRVIREVN